MHTTTTRPVKVSWMSRSVSFLLKRAFFTDWKKFCMCRLGHICYASHSNPDRWCPATFTVLTEYIMAVHRKRHKAIYLTESEQRFLFLHQLLVVSLSVRIIAAVLQIQFHSEWLEVMWLGQTWAERLSTRLKQQHCLRTATVHHPRDKSLNINIVMDLTKILNTANKLFTQKCEVWDWEFEIVYEELFP